MIDYEMKLEKEVSYLENPFQVDQIPTTSIDNFAIVGNLNKINQLDNSGRLVLKYVLAGLNQHTAITKLEVKGICINAFKNYPNERVNTNFYSKVANTLEIRIRRGIKNLLYNEVIAKTKVKDMYFVNKSIIWR